LLLLPEEVQLLLLMRLETALLFGLIGGELREVPALLLLQTAALLRLMGPEGRPVLLPPVLVEVVLVELRRLCLGASRSARRVLTRR